MAKLQAPSAIPPEIFDIIIDFLYDDKRTLSACSLVCSQWLPSTKYHLFSSLRISDDGDDTDYNHRTQWLRPFAAFLQNPATTIRPFVKVLQLSPRHGRTGCPRRDCEVNELLHLVNLIPNLRSLRLQCLALVDSLDGSISSDINTIVHESLRTLSMARMDLTDRSIEVLFSALPAVRSIKTTGLYFPSAASKSEDTASESVPFNLPQLRSLVLDVRPPHPNVFELDYLVSHPSQLTTLDVTLYDNAQSVSQAIQYFGKFIGNIGIALTRLRLDISWLNLEDLEIETLSTMPNAITLAECPNLENLHLKIFMVFMSYPYDTVLQWQYALRLLSQAPRILKHITIGLRTDISTTVDDERLTTGLSYLSWRDLDTELFSRLSSLQSIGFRAEPSGSLNYALATFEDPKPLGPGWEQYLRDMLPRAHSLGLLSFPNIEPHALDPLDW